MPNSQIGLLVLGLVVGPLAAYGQATPAAVKRVRVQLGIGISAARPDYGMDKWIKGGTFYGDMGIGPHWGIEGEIHNLDFFTPADIGESSYLLGVNYRFTRSAFHPYVKVLAGLGRFQYQHPNYPATTSTTYKLVSFGAGAEYDLTPRLDLRLIDLEYQEWPGFSVHGLTPLVGTIGLAYRLPF